MNHHDEGSERRRGFAGKQWPGALANGHGHTWEYGQHIITCNNRDHLYRLPVFTVTAQFLDPCIYQ